MRHILKEVEQHFAEVGFTDCEKWNSLYIDYETPVVERLWTPWGLSRSRVYIHRIHPCKVDDALFHPHPWGSAMRILSGTYSMLVGYGDPNGKEPEDVMYQEIPSGTLYEMESPMWWHSVAPKAHVITLMVTDEPWKSDFVAPPTPKQRSLTHEEKRVLVYDAGQAFFNRGR